MKWFLVNRSEVWIMAAIAGAINRRRFEITYFLHAQNLHTNEPNRLNTDVRSWTRHGSKNRDFDAWVVENYPDPRIPNQL